MVKIDISELKKRLEGSMSAEEIDELIDRHSGLASENMPNMEIITGIARKPSDLELSVRFVISEKEYSSLINHYYDQDESQASIKATILVKRVLSDFLETID